MRARRGADVSQFAEGDRAVSKVVGVLLLTGIVIALAATVAGMMTGFAGLLSDPAPQVAFDAEYHDNVDDPDRFHPDLSDEASYEIQEVVVIEHVGGKRFDPKQTRYVVTRSGTTLLDTTWSDVFHGQENAVATTDTLYPYAAGSETLSDVRIQLIWQNENDQGTVLFEWEGPSA